MPKKSKLNSRLFRPNVAALIMNAQDELFIAERFTPKGAWQFPQGGVDPGEDFEDALFREVWEETGIPRTALTIEDRREGYRYQFPKNKRKWGIYCGQEQTYFLLRFRGDDTLINLELHKPEFRSFRWIKPVEFSLDWVPEFKYPVFERVLRDFFNVELERPAKTVKPGKIHKNIKKMPKKIKEKQHQSDSP